MYDNIRIFVPLQGQVHIFRFVPPADSSHATPIAHKKLLGFLEQKKSQTNNVKTKTNSWHNLSQIVSNRCLPRTSTYPDL